MSEFLRGGVVAALVALMAVGVGPAARAVTLTWTNNSASADWNTNVADTNWTADGGATHVPWTQDADAVFDATSPAGTVSVQGGVMRLNSLSIDVSRTISKRSGNDADQLQLTGAALITVPAGQSLSLPYVSGSAGMVLTGGGTASSSRGLGYTGGTTILNGTWQTGNTPNVPGPVTLLDTAGTADARLFFRGINSSWTYSEPITVRAGSSGRGILENSPTTGSGFTPTLASNLTLNNTFNVKLTGTQAVRLTLSGLITGPGDLELEFTQSNHQFVLSGDAAGHTGDIRVIQPGSRSGLSLVLNGPHGSSNLTVPTGVAVSGAGTLTYNLFNDTGDLINLAGTSTLDLSGFTLQPSVSGTPTILEYPITNRLTGISGTFVAVQQTSPFYSFLVDYDGTALNPSAVVLQLQLVPEPAAAGLLAAGVLLGFLRRHRH